MDEIVGGIVNLLHAAARALDAFATHRELAAQQLTLDIAIKQASLAAAARFFERDHEPPTEASVTDEIKEG